MWTAVLATRSDTDPSPTLKKSKIVKSFLWFLSPFSLALPHLDKMQKNCRFYVRKSYFFEVSIDLLRFHKNKQFLREV